MTDYSQGRLCDIYEKPFRTEDEWEDRHEEHESYCQNFGQDDNEDHKWVTCDCDLVYHAACCPECNP